MVLQRDVDVPIWGSAKPEQKISVQFANQIKSTQADVDGHWMVILDPLEASKIGKNLIVSADTSLEIKDVVVGEVWICSGQSNMQFSVERVPAIKSLIPFLKNIRAFEVKRTVSFQEERSLEGVWKVTNPESAVAFGFAYFLEALGDIPIGIIHTSWGSSSLEAWMPRDMADNLPYFKKIMEIFDADTLTHNKIQKALSTTSGWTLQEDVFLRRQPNLLYNAMMKPLAPFACRGLVWYQGERNARYMSGLPKYDENFWYHQVIGMKEYGDVLKLWMERYRKEWGNNNMHFSIVMLPGFGTGTIPNPNIDPESPTAESWSWMRESQLKVLDLPNTSVVNTIDLGDIKEIHPTDKLPIGQRLALQAAKYTLNQDVLAEGPMMTQVDIKNNLLIVHFKNAVGLKTIDNKDPRGFWISDDALIWKPAKAEIKGETLLLSNNDIKNPLYIRYAFAGKPDVNLVNNADLPAYPYRTDTK